MLGVVIVLRRDFGHAVHQNENIPAIPLCRSWKRNDSAELLTLLILKRCNLSGLLGMPGGGLRQRPVSCRWNQNKSLQSLRLRR